MALKFMEGFDSLADTNNTYVQDILRQSGWVECNMCAVTTNTRTGRGMALRMRPSSPAGQREADAFWASAITTGFVVGFACNFNDGQDDIFLAQYDNLAGSITTRFRLYKNGVAGLSILTSGGSLLAASENNVIFPAEWNYIEIKVLPGQTQPHQIIVKVNGCVIINAEVNLGGSFNRYGFRANYFGGWEGTGAGGQDMTRIDDLYWCDLTGGEFDDFIGDVVIEDIRPNGDGGPNGLTGVGIIGDHYQAVDEQSPDNDTTYLMTDQLNEVERFNCTDLPDDVIDVLAVGVYVRARRDGTGYRTFRAQVELNDVVLEGDDKFTSTGYQEQGSVFTTKPGGGLWTVADVNNVQIGFKTTPLP